MNGKTKFLTQSAVIAALYVVLTYVSNMFGLANGAIQLRFSEALTLLPAFTSAAVPGLFIGCLAANLLCGNMLFDVIFGSAATLLGAVGTYYFGKNKYIAPLFPIISNTVIIPFVLKYIYSFEGSLLYFVITVGIGEILSCGVLGIILWNGIEKTNLFKR